MLCAYNKRVYFDDSDCCQLVVVLGIGPFVIIVVVGSTTNVKQNKPFERLVHCILTYFDLSFSSIFDVAGFTT